MGPIDPEFYSLKSTNDSVDHYDYHVLKCGENMFTEVRTEETHSLSKDEYEGMSLGNEFLVGNEPE